MRALLRCGACVLALCFAPALRALELGEPLFQSVGDADSIPDNNVTALAQDTAGYIWIGTPNGLIRYDGYQLRRFTRDPRDPNSLGGAFVRALLVGRDGRIWIGTDANGVSVYDPARDRFTRMQHDPQRSDTPSHDQVRAMALGHDGAHAPDLAPGLAQPLEGLRAGHLVHEVAVDVEDGGAIVFGVDDVVVPELVVERAGHGVKVP